MDGAYTGDGALRRIPGITSRAAAPGKNSFLAVKRVIEILPLYLPNDWQLVPRSVAALSLPRSEAWPWYQKRESAWAKGYQRMNLPAAASLAGVWGSRSDDVWMVGDGGTVL